MKEITVKSKKIIKSKPLKKDNSSFIKSRFAQKTVNTKRVEKTPSKLALFLKKKKFLLVFLLLIAILSGFLFTKGYTILSLLSATGLKIDNPLNVMFGDSSDKFETDENGYTNVLALGVDSNREGVFSNVDTIMIISYDAEENIAQMISIPRDTVVQHTLKTDKKDYTKRYERINAMYAVGEKQLGEGEGLGYLISVVENYIGLDIHYSIVINFKAFVKVVDSIGGIDVEVENSFTDRSYPTWDYSGYQTVKFTAGMTHMDGDTALKFARSRHGPWPEGTDFARSKRQQKVIAAIQEKINSEKSLQSISFWEDMLNALGKNILLYNVGTNDIKKAYDLYMKNGIPSIVGIVLDPSVANWTILGEGVITFGNSPQFAITPKPDYKDYEPLQEFLKYYFDNPFFVDESAIISVYVAGGEVADVKQLVEDLEERYPYHKIQYHGIYPDIEITGFAVIDISGTKPTSITEYKGYLKSFLSETSNYPEITKARYGEDVVILIGGK